MRKGEIIMKRRELLKYLVAGGTAIAFSGGTALAMQYPQEMGDGLFDGINRVKDPAKKTGLEMKHAPVISAPAKVKAGEPFDDLLICGLILYTAAVSNLAELGENHRFSFLILPLLLTWLVSRAAALAGRLKGARP